MQTFLDPFLYLWMSIQFAGKLPTCLRIYPKTILYKTQGFLLSSFNSLMYNVPKWLDTQQMLQDFYSVSHHFGTLCIKGLNSLMIQHFIKHCNMMWKYFFIRFFFHKNSFHRLVVKTGGLSHISQYYSRRFTKQVLRLELGNNDIQTQYLKHWARSPWNVFQTRFIY